MPEDFLSGQGSDNPVMKGAMAATLRHEQIMRLIGMYRDSRDRGDITDAQFEAIRDDLMKKAIGDPGGSAGSP
jgi:hypothetical protein